MREPSSSRGVTGEQALPKGPAPLGVQSKWGHVFWLFGLSGAGKSTLATALAAQWDERALMLDGDRLRAGLCAGLGFSDMDRMTSLCRAAQVARLGVESGLPVIAALITPREEQRRAIDEIVGSERISFIYVNASLAICRRRDVKGLYARAEAGTVSYMTGISSEFERPIEVSLQLNTDAEPLGESVARLAGFARAQLRRHRGELGS